MVYPRPKEVKELGLYPIQLYNVLTDSTETVNLAGQNPEVVERLTKLMEKYISDGRSTPGPKQKNEGETVLFKNK
jgi:hypothetical protein